MNKIELLSPAGDLERLKLAIKYGANAVYIGGRDYSLRANAANFSLEDIDQAVKFAHAHGACVYVTVNIIFHNHDFIGLVDYLKSLEQLKVDAIIVADVAVLKIMQENKINLNVHISTQLSNINYQSVAYFKELGATRIVLGREVSKEDIKNILEHVDIELEVFIHGAMCTAYSGRCVMSSYFTNRDPNRGGCSQICRFDFKMLKQNEYIDSDINFSMCAKDLSMINHLRELIELGVKSLKIEGRMRSGYYISNIVRTYRQAIDRYYKDPVNFKIALKDYEHLKRVSNREAVSHFLDKEVGVNEQYYNNRQEVSNQDFLAMVLSYDSVKQEAIISQRNYFKVGDEVILFGPNLDDYKFIIKYIKNKDGDLVEVANHPKEELRIFCPIEVVADDMIRIRWNNE